MDGTPHVRYPYTRDAEAGEDQECNRYAGQEFGVDRRGNGDTADKNRETEHGDCHREYLPERSHCCDHTGRDAEIADIH